MVSLVFVYKHTVFGDPPKTVRFPSNKLNGTLQTDPQVARAIRYSAFFGVRSGSPIGDFLEL